MERDPYAAFDLFDLERMVYWANLREVEPHYLRTSFQGQHHEVCWLIERGSLKLTDASGNRQIGPQTWVFPSRTSSRQEFSPRSRIISIRFLLRLRGGEPLFPRERQILIKPDREPGLEKTARGLVDAFRRWSPATVLTTGRGELPLLGNLEIEAAFHHWLVAYVGAMRRLGAQPRRLENEDSRAIRAAAWIEAFPLMQRFYSEDLAAHCGLSVNQLNRVFQTSCGQTPYTYYEARRLSVARELLSHSMKPIKTIAYELAFSSPSHFSAWFTKHVGQSPRAFRSSPR